MASFSAATQNAAPVVFDNRQAGALRPAQSVIATR
jgi:hypothetical protein